MPVAEEPVVVKDTVLSVERALRTPGDIHVRIGEAVEPQTVVASMSVETGRTVAIHVARDLSVPPDAIRRYLTKPLGSQFDMGEEVARSRRGLRTAASTAPVSGTLSELDENTGVALIVPTTAGAEVHAVVSGEVAAVEGDQRVMIRTQGSRVRGALGFGNNSWGPIKVAVDRPDRELTPDAVTPELRGAIVLGGMTVGSAAIRRLAEVGARGVVVGSVAEAEIRRAIPADREVTAQRFWKTGATIGPLADGLENLPIPVLVTEGFGRRPMAALIFQFLGQREGQMASLLLSTATSLVPTPPYLYLYSPAVFQDDVRIPAAEFAEGVLARLVDPQNLGTVVTCQSGVLLDRRRDGLARQVVQVTMGSQTRVVPVSNLEVLMMPD